jgi:hypothetical protein
MGANSNRSGKPVGAYLSYFAEVKDAPSEH